MLNEGVGSWTARRARKTPGARAILHAGRTLSYAGLHDRVSRLARALRRRRLRLRPQCLPAR